MVFPPSTFPLKLTWKPFFTAYMGFLRQKNLIAAPNDVVRSPLKLRRLPTPTLLLQAFELGRRTERPPNNIWVTQDNDPKHYNEVTNQLIEELGFKLLASHRRNEEGEFDTCYYGTQGKRGYRTVHFPDKRFPAYSPDLNGVIEKCWRELQRRYTARAHEIKSVADMKRVIIEEWEGLEFEAGTEEKPNVNNWSGINAMVDKFPKICRTVAEQEGWDTKYMK
jgi:hypothetical protein